VLTFGFGFEKSLSSTMFQPGITTPNMLGACEPNTAYLVRPPEGLCGIGNQASPVWPAKVYTDETGKFQVVWECCHFKGLATCQMLPSHHSNKTVTPLDCPIIAVIGFKPDASLH
jgi:hypothetical protein